MTLGEGHFHDACLANDPEVFVREMSDETLRTLLNYLIGKNQQQGIAGEVWIVCLAEAARRFQQGGVR